MEDFKRISRTLKYQGKLVGFYVDEISLPNGNTVYWDFLKHNGAAAVVPVLEDGRIILVKQYRNALDRYTLEIPAGGLNENEPTDVASARELKEETGYTCAKLEPLITIRTTVAFCDEKIDIYVAEGLKPGHQNLDEDEFINCKCYELDEIIQMIFDGKIEDSKTISAIMSYKARKSQ